MCEKEVVVFKFDVFDLVVKLFLFGLKEVDCEWLLVVLIEFDVQQECLYMQQKKCVLFVLQGMDMSGKDGIVCVVFCEVDLFGLCIVLFKVLMLIEVVYDFLWCVYVQVLVVGEFVIFNCSYYEDVLVLCVFGVIGDKECECCYWQICDFEMMLFENGMMIIKCFLYILKDEQCVWLQVCIDDLIKYWKFDIVDFDVCKYWDVYQFVYCDVFVVMLVEYVLWYVILVNLKMYCNVMIVELLLCMMIDMKLEFLLLKFEFEGVKIC